MINLGFLAKQKMVTLLWIYKALVNLLYEPLVAKTTLIILGRWPNLFSWSLA